ncbi:type I phosphomannose isomerase catalytic subunit, partial [Faecalibaculum rodentium]
GADNISKARGEDKAYGTWWEVSAHPYCQSPVLNIPGKNLLEVIEENPEEVLGPGLGLHEMLRLAWLDTKDRLSIQVHPQDDNAPEGDFGKSESWYVLDAKPGATLVAGTKTTDADVIRKALEDGTLDEYLVKWPVKKGDFIYIPSGMLHALGADITAIEVGTNSNTTYRFYDYGRTDAQGNPRPLHLKESFEVTDFALKPVFVPAADEDHVLADAPQFTVTELFIGEEPVEIETGETYFVLSNMGEDTDVIWNGEAFPLKALSSVVIPWSAGKVTLKNAHVLESRPKK